MNAHDGAPAEECRQCIHIQSCAIQGTIKAVRPGLVRDEVRRLKWRDVFSMKLIYSTGFGKCLFSYDSLKRFRQDFLLTGTIEFGDGFLRG